MSNSEKNHPMNSNPKNKSGVPLQTKDSKQIRAEHRHWQREIQSLEKQKSSKGTRYWKSMSACAML